MIITFIAILPNKMNLSKQILGSSLSLPAYGRAGQGQHLFFLAAHFAKRNTKFGGGKIGIGKRGRAKIPSHVKKTYCSFSNCDQFRHFLKIGVSSILIKIPILF